MRYDQLERFYTTTKKLKIKQCEKFPDLQSNNLNQPNFNNLNNKEFRQ